MRLGQLAPSDASEGGGLDSPSRGWIWVLREMGYSGLGFGLLFLIWAGEEVPTPGVCSEGFGRLWWFGSIGRKGLRRWFVTFH